MSELTLAEILPDRGQLELSPEWIEHYDPDWPLDLDVDCPDPDHPAQYIDRQLRLYTEYEGSSEYQALVFGYQFETEAAAVSFYSDAAQVLSTCDSSRDDIAEHLRETSEGLVEMVSLVAVPEPAQYRIEEPTASIAIHSGSFVVVVTSWDGTARLGAEIPLRVAQRVQNNLLAWREGRPIPIETPFATYDLRSQLVEALYAVSVSPWSYPRAWTPDTRRLKVPDLCGDGSPLLRDDFLATARSSDWLPDLADARIDYWLTLLPAGVDPVEFADAMSEWQQCTELGTAPWSPWALEMLAVDGHGDVEVITSSRVDPVFGESHIRTIVDGSVVFVVVSEVVTAEAGRDVTPEVATAIAAFLEQDW